jgi:glycosyltransferase involved in cell wall biosynthesis
VTGRSRGQLGVPDRPAILFVAVAGGLGGSMRSLATVLSGLDGVHRVVACVPRTTFTELIGERGLCDELVELPIGGRSRIAGSCIAIAAIACCAWRHRQQLTAIHANGLAERILVTPAAILTRAPVVVWMHGWSVRPWSRRSGPLLRLLVPRTSFAAVSPDARASLVEAGLVRLADVLVVPNPIDPVDVMAPSRVAHSPTTIGYLGTPARYKGFDLLPGIIRCLAGERIRWHIYAGPRTAMPEVWSELIALTGADVQMHDKVTDVGLAYGECDIVLCPSREESFGRVAAEAMCNGLAVVASDLPPLRDLLGDDEAGLLVPPGDVEAAAGALRRLLADPQLRHQLGRVGSVRVQRFAPPAIVAQLADLYGVGVPRSHVQEVASPPCP